MVDNWRRHPKGDGDGGKFAPKPSMESTVDLGEDQVGYEPDGSKAFEERNKKPSKVTEQSTESTVESSSESVPLELDVVAFEKEFGVRATAPDPRVKRAPDVPPPGQKPIKLGGAVEYAEGSWQYPPPPTLNTAKMAAYWSNVLIPDNALQNLENADRDRDFLLYEKEFDEWRSSQPSPTPRYRKKHPDEYAVYSTEYDVRQAIVERVQFHIGLIPRHELRDVARLCAFWEQARGLGEESVSRAAATEFVASSGEIVKPLDVVQKYRTWEISDALFNRVRYSRPD